MTGRIEGKTAVITGGAGGIGYAVAERFLKEGAQVLIGDLPDSAAVPEGAAYRQTDVSNGASVEALLSDAKDRFGGTLDILVTCAGIEIEKNIEDTTEEEWDRSINVNLKGTFLAAKYAVPLMRAGGGGSIVTFGSYDGFIADPQLAAYCASKGGVHALTRAMACDYGPEGIRCNAVCPGYVETPMLQSFFGSAGDIDALQEEVRNVHPIRRWGQPSDVANLVLWLASDEAGYASGQLWVLDGGLSAQVQQMRLA
jgi:NAD(P)-dependent dehydrogenase (short-subunit alcohol dehydrogenase family)